jgi:hypothetical protein
MVPIPVLRLQFLEEVKKIADETYTSNPTLIPLSPDDLRLPKFKQQLRNLHSGQQQNVYCI